MSVWRDKRAARKFGTWPASLLVVALLVAPGAWAEEGDTLASLHEELVRLVQKDETIVAASPALCAERGLTPARVGPGDPRADVKRWYFSARGCNLPFPVDLEGVVTRATKGFERDLLRSPEAVEQLRDLLDRIGKRLDAETPSPQQRLMIHSLVWEVGSAVDMSRSMRSTPELAAATCDNYSVLQKTVFSAESAAALPSTLESLPETGGAPEIADLVARIIARDPQVIEILPTTEAHAKLLLGRFTPRIFFTARDEAARKQAAEYLKIAPYGAKGQLPLRVPGVEAVLVLYFNVVTEDLQILPTEQVAFWQQYDFNRQLSLQPDEFAQAEEAIRFVSVRYRRDFSGEKVLYAKLPESAMTRHGFVDAMPPAPAAPVTTLRGACIKCHRRVLSSFHPEEKRELELTPPFEHGGQELLTPVFERHRARLQAWKALCESPAPAAEASERTSTR